MFKRSSSALKSWVVVSVGALVLALSAFFILSNFSPNSIFAQTPPDTYAQKVRLVPGPVDNDLIYLADPITISYDEKGTGPVTTFTSSDPDTEAARIEWAVTGPDAADFEISAAGVLSFKNPPNFEKPTDRGFDGNLDETIDPSPESAGTESYLVGASTITLDETVLGIDLDGDGNTTTTSVNLNDLLPEAQLGIDINNDGDLDDTGDDAVQSTASQPVDEGAGNNVYLIVVRATEVRPSANGLRAASTATQVRVLVNDLDEDGEITLDWRQPQVDRPITATLKDDDVAGGETFTPEPTWTWYISTVDNPRLRVNDDWMAVTTGIDTSETVIDATTSRTPQTADKDRFLRVMASYPDTQGTGNKTAFGMSDFPVRAVPASNGSPDFGQGAEIELTVPENRKGNVGDDPVTATDRNTGDNLTYELLAYTEDNNTDLSTNVQATNNTGARPARPNDAGFFRIDKATGQLSTPVGLDHEYEFDHDNDNDANTAALENYIVIVKVTDPSDDADAVRVTITASDEDDPPSISKPVGIPYTEHHVNEENSEDVDGTAGIDAPYKDADFTASYHPTGTGDNTYTAADQDDDLINWTIMGPDAGDFKACGGGNLCTVNFKNAPDFDAPADANWGQRLPDKAGGPLHQLGGQPGRDRGRPQRQRNRKHRSLIGPAHRAGVDRHRARPRRRQGVRQRRETWSR